MNAAGELAPGGEQVRAAPYLTSRRESDIDYNVVRRGFCMRGRAAKRVLRVPPHPPTSLRLPRATRQAVQALARQRGESMHAALQRLIEEGMRMATCPGILFVDGVSGRRACIAGTGIDVWEVARALHSCQGDEGAMRALYPQLSHAQVTAALRYAKASPGEISERIALAEAAEAEAMKTFLPLKVC